LSDPSDAVKNIRRQDARVIVGLFYVVAARRVLCEVYKHKLYGKSYVWFFIGKLSTTCFFKTISQFVFLPGWYEDDWFEQNLEKEKINCTREQMRTAAEGHLTTEALMWNQNSQRTISGMVIIQIH
jgi:gamma-aminobutyric acid type B receptor